MTLTKAHIVEAVVEETEFTKKKSAETVEALLEIIKSTLESGDEVLYSGFGKFSVKDKKERRGRNPETGDAMMLKPRRIVTFKWSGKLRKRMNR